jgi:hypothetical protein
MRAGIDLRGNRIRRPAAPLQRLTWEHLGVRMEAMLHSALVLRAGIEPGRVQCLAEV